MESPLVEDFFAKLCGHNNAHIKAKENGSTHFIYRDEMAKTGNNAETREFYRIGVNELDDIYESYGDCIEEDLVDFTFTEKLSNYRPFTCKINLSSKSSKTRTFSDVTLKNICSNVQYVIRDHLVVASKDMDMYVLASDEKRKHGSNYLEEIRIVCPKVFLDSKMHMKLCNAISEMFAETEVFKKLLSKGGDFNVDTSYISKGEWNLYGCLHTGGIKCELMSIFREVKREKNGREKNYMEPCSDKTFNRYFDNPQALVKCLSMCKNLSRKDLAPIITKEVSEEDEDSEEEKSIDLWDAEHMAKAARITHKSREEIRSHRRMETASIGISQDKNRDPFNYLRMIDMLNINTRNNLSDLTIICSALKNRDTCQNDINNGDEYFATYHDITHGREAWKYLCAKFKLDEGQKIWNSCHRYDKYAESSFRTMCRKDNREEFIEMLMDECEEVKLASTQKIIHEPASQICYILLRDFVRVPYSTKSDIYHYRNNVWRAVERGCLFGLVMKNLKPYLYELQKRYNNMCASDPEENLFYQRKAMKVAEYINSAGSSGFINGVIPFLAEHLRRENVKVDLDKNPDIVVAGNGVYDLKSEIFRDGYPGDNSTMTLGVDYVEFDKDSPDVREVRKIMRDIMPDRKMRKFMLTAISQSLSGRIFSNDIYFAVGDGGNGKSALFGKWVASVLGMSRNNQNSGEPYYKVLDASTIDTKNKGGSAGNATPHLADKKGCRFIQIDEPNKNQEVCGSSVKRLTGDDLITCRGLFKDQDYYFPQFKIWILLNKLIKFDDMDGGVVRRLNILEFTTKFLDEVEYMRRKKRGTLQENERMKDNSMADKVDSLAPAFASLLFHMFIKFKRNGYVMEKPESVTKATNEYIKKTDSLYRFTRESLHCVAPRGEDGKVTKLVKEHPVSIRKIHNALTEWLQSNGDRRTFSKTELHKYLLANYRSFYVDKGSERSNLYQHELRDMDEIRDLIDKGEEFEDSYEEEDPGYEDDYKELFNVGYESEEDDDLCEY